MQLRADLFRPFLNSLTENKKYSIIARMTNKKSNKDLPKSIKIGYLNYQFDFWPDTFASTEKAQGEFFEEAGKIGIKSSAIPSVQGVNTLFHEILHAAIYQYGLQDTLEGHEEKVVNTLANGLTTVFVDNKWLVDYIKKYA